MKHKPQAEMEMIFLASDGHALKTGVGCAAETNAKTYALFRNAKRAEVPKHRAQFLLDYYNTKGDLLDTIFLDAAGYKIIANEPVRSEAAYRKIDAAYWRKAQKKYAAEKRAASIQPHA